jgi:NAD(P)-dependent dehydrogenase (short-subunit alcohol dehydrogenase family)
MNSYTERQMRARDGSKLRTQCDGSAEVSRQRAQKSQSIMWCIPKRRVNSCRQSNESTARRLAIQPDVSDSKAVEELFRQVDGAWGGIDILVNNAGVDGSRARGWEADIDAWRKAIDVNLFGSFLLRPEALGMREYPGPHARRMTR